MPNLLLAFENPETCLYVARIIMEAQSTGKQMSGVRAANLLSRLTTGCVVYGPLPEPGPPQAQASGVIPCHAPNADEIPQHTPSVEKVPTDRVWTEEEMRALLAIEKVPVVCPHCGVHDAIEVERIHCARCGKSVSTPVPKPTIVRAWVECPECIEVV